ncbi:hypothetical protein GPECTOR_1g13 [Gonium pectorale]|uniref:Plastid lipid-associated protein/fibrillin conserved domain-containing protein n=1 Tax=Gonium pectorale TaxID=33097 RepID=A0A150H2E6_GONPE|nr:hypothetical protein GPECTOR_1g13 [Gonium pectorale]|eukprot:KXZ56152.1 hypothetical protein GPECTOR_1g13 [Gonium pectorale]
MQALLQKRALAVGKQARSGSACKPVSTRASSIARHARSGKTGRRSTVECRAFFSFFTPKPAAPAPLVDPRAKPLVEQLIALTSGTDAGAKATADQKEEIAALVTELSRYCMKNPLKSDLLFGEWKASWRGGWQAAFGEAGADPLHSLVIRPRQVLFASKATAVSGPLRSGAGQAVFPGQKARQILEAPNKLINLVEYKTLGFLPGSSRQFGEIQPISPDTFILNITSGELSTGLGGPQKKEFNIQRKIKILYLDEDIRVALFLPSEELADSEADQVRQQIKERGGSAKVVAPAPARQGSVKINIPAPQRAASVRGRRQPEPEPEEDPRERRRREQEEERARKAAEAEARAAEAKAARERAEAERQAEREKQAAIKELLAKLTAEIKERQAEAKEAAKQLRDVEKSAGSGLKEVLAARSRLEEAEADVKSVSAQLDSAAAAKKEAEKAARDAKDVVVAAEKALRARITAASPVIARK